MNKQDYKYIKKWRDRLISELATIEYEPIESTFKQGEITVLEILLDNYDLKIGNASILHHLGRH